MKSSVVFVFVFWCKVELAVTHRIVPYQPDDKVKATVKPNLALVKTLPYLQVLSSGVDNKVQTRSLSHRRRDSLS